MRLSDAIRLGAMLKPQIREYLRAQGKTCALGAACDAIGVPYHVDGERSLHMLGVEVPYIYLAAKCPACLTIVGMWRRFRDKEYDLEDVVIHLNDDHQWTRERIADWVQTVEPRDTERHKAARTDDAVARGAEASTSLTARA